MPFSLPLTHSSFHHKIHQPSFSLLLYFLYYVLYITRLSPSPFPSHILLVISFRNQPSFSLFLYFLYSVDLPECIIGVLYITRFTPLSLPLTHSSRDFNNRPFPSPIFPLHSLPSPAHPAGFSFYNFPGFLAIFKVVSSTTRK